MPKVTPYPLTRCRDLYCRASELLLACDSSDGSWSAVVKLQSFFWLTTYWWTS